MFLGLELLREFIEERKSLVFVGFFALTVGCNPVPSPCIWIVFGYGFMVPLFFFSKAFISSFFYN